ncbi:small ribosomal subunit Rsm22 family protein [Streptomyces sp. MAR4 CNX-425]|uniref:small ribosomal subunit Rsm22 family protein n=1 Tax=Streptomyces sp. MAR4 CNX-425 TaxID=3406343 RepID=UPI003B50DBC2
MDRLVAGYRGGGPAPALRDREDVAAYAAYRMPATFQAVRAALGALADAAPGWEPDSHLDVGGGTGAAVWAAAAVWPDEPDGSYGPDGSDGSDGLDEPDGPEAPRAAGPRPTVVLDHAEPALALGRELAAGAAAPAVRAAEWRRHPLGPAAPGPAWAAAGLVTVSYVLGELPADVRRAVVAAAARSARGAVVVVEPGTPEGYRRVLDAREQLVGDGFEVLAPCPHSAACPMAGTADWCHFAARVQRSALHRRVKGGELGHEDEKFAYVAAARPVRTGGAPAAGRVVRHPQLRKGQVLLQLCTAGEGLARTVVSKRQGPRYRAARDLRWGDAWPPPGDGGHGGP